MSDLLHPTQGWVNSCLRLLKALIVAYLLISLMYLLFAGMNYAVLGAVFDEEQHRGSQLLIAILLLAFVLTFALAVLALRVRHQHSTAGLFIKAALGVEAIALLALLTSFFGVRESAFGQGGIGGITVVFCGLNGIALLLALEVELFNRDHPVEDADVSEVPAEDAPGAFGAFADDFEEESAVDLDEGEDSSAEFAPEDEPEVEPEFEEELESEGEPEPEAELDSEAEEELQSEDEPECGEELEPEEDAELEIEAGPETDIDEELEPEPEAEPAFEVEAESEFAPEFEPEAESEPAEELDSEVEPETEFDPAEESEFEAEPTFTSVEDLDDEPEAEGELELDEEPAPRSGRHYR